ncbi:GNAT family N-acetyltransferase [Prauserella marina]|nr:GNAT family N-acetyltransferase [Prauserella marina]
MPHTTRTATTADIEPAVATLTAAFADYPFTRHIIASDDHLGRLARSNRLFLSDIGLAHGQVWVAAAEGGDPDSVDAVAVWTTPASSDGIAEAFAGIAGELADIAGDRVAIAGATEAALQPHRPTTPAWFLGSVGVRPETQGRGLGKAVIEPGLLAADEQRATAYLETSLPANVMLYRKLGFEVTAEVKLPEGGPLTWAMYRDPR